MKLLKKSQDKQIRSAVDDEEELDEDQDEEEEEQEEEVEEHKPKVPMFKKESKEKVMEDGTIDKAIMPLGNGDFRPGYNVWLDGKTLFTTEEIIAEMSSRIIKATKT